MHDTPASDGRQSIAVARGGAAMHQMFQSVRHSQEGGKEPNPPKDASHGAGPFPAMSCRSRRALALIGALRCWIVAGILENVRTATSSSQSAGVNHEEARSTGRLHAGRIARRGRHPFGTAWASHTRSSICEGIGPTYCLPRQSAANQSRTQVRQYNLGSETHSNFGGRLGNLFSSSIG